MPIKNKINVVELFAGVGGFRLGLERANNQSKHSNFAVVFSNQWEPGGARQHASEVYVKKWGAENHHTKDVALITKKDLPNKVDLVVGGFPCQDYSVANALGKAKGIVGKKGVLWWELARIIEISAPKYIFLENVDRLLSSPFHQKGRDFAVMLAKLSDLGYAVEWRVINAAEYGYPQKRKRIFIFGVKKRAKLSKEIRQKTSSWLLHEGVFAKAFPQTLKVNHSIEIFDLKGNLSDISSNFGVGNKVKPFKNSGLIVDRVIYQASTTSNYEGASSCLRDIVQGDEVSPEFLVFNHQIEDWFKVKKAKRVPRITSDGFEYLYSEGEMKFPDPLNAPSRTIITSEGGVSPSRIRHVIMTPGGTLRRLTPIELERLNGFDDNHTLIHNISSNKRAFLMGNALVTGIVRDFGCSLDKLLARLDGINAKSLDAKSSKKKLNKLKKNYSEV